jgi:hypothetical protein
LCKQGGGTTVSAPQLYLAGSHLNLSVCTLDDYKVVVLQQYIWDDAEFCYPAHESVQPLLDQQRQQEQEQAPAAVAAMQHSATDSTGSSNSDLMGTAAVPAAVAVSTAAVGAELQSQHSAERQ